MNIANFEQALEMFNLTTLSKQHDLHILTMSGGDAQDLPEGTQMRIVFYKNQTIGFIVMDMICVNPHYFKGGKWNNAIVENSINLIMETYRLKTSMGLNFNETQMQVLVELKAFVATINDQMDLELIKSMLDNAKALNAELKNDEITRIANVINKRYVELQNSVGDSTPAMKLRLEALVTGLRESENPDERAGMLTEAKNLLNKIPGDESTKGARVFIENLEKEMRSAGAGKKNDPSIEDLEELEEEIQTINDEYLNELSKGQKAFDAQDFVKAKKHYQRAKILKPKMSEPGEKLHMIEGLISKTGKKD